MKNAVQVKELFEAHLRGLELGQGSPSREFYEPMRYILALKAKRIRPVLALLSYQAVTGRDPAEAVNIGLTIEIFHNFTLVHDDIMDNAPVRRGQPSIHVKWDPNTAILAGDGMYALSITYLTPDFPHKAAELIGEYSRICLGVCEGQMEDMLLAERETGTIPEYLEMIRKKTAVLIGGSLALGAIAGGADQATVDKIREYGEMVGVGFQLQDDYLDAFASAEKFGKQPGGDILENKKTFLLQKALELATGEDLKQLEYLLNEEQDSAAKVKGVVEVFDRLNIRELTRNKIDEYFVKAKDLGGELSSLPGFEYITEVLDALIKRDY